MPVRQNIILERRPFATVVRAVLWLGHCALGIPATVKIGKKGPLMRLEPRIRHYGSTTLYMRREEYEPTLSFLVSVIEESDVILDVGANFGVYSLVLAQRTRSTGGVVAFEPGAEALLQLRHNLSLNPRLHVDVVPIALSDRSGSASLAHIGGPPTYGITDSAIGEPVELATLDSWIERSQCPPPDLVKVDVEGHEPAVFAGGRATFATARPLVVFEVSFQALQRSGYAHDASYDALSELGYGLFRLRGETLEPIGGVEEGNLVAVHPSSRWVERLAVSVRSTRRAGADAR